MKKADGVREVETRCGLGSCRPACLQAFNNSKCACFLLSIFAFVQGFAVNGINNVNTTQYERRFQLSSTTVGWISSAFDISASILGIFISFYGNKRNKPRFLAAAMFVSALGSMLMFLPHFITDLYEWGYGRDNKCLSKAPAPEVCDPRDASLKNYLFMLIGGQVLHGVGSATLLSVGITYIDDSVRAIWSPVYVAIIELFYIFGPLVGYLAGANILSLYVDFDQIPKDEQTLTIRNPSWVGAWWLPYIISSAIMFLISLPFWLYGQELPNAQEVHDARMADGCDKADTPLGWKDNVTLKMLPPALLNLLKNKTYVCVCLAYVCLGILLIGTGTFINKYIQNELGLDAQEAGNLLGLFTMPTVILGVIFSGVMLKCLNLDGAGILRFIIALLVIGTATKVAFYLKCDRPLITGFNTPYSNSSEISEFATCNEKCFCDPARFEPVCDMAGTKYLNPCLAGCKNMTAFRVYDNCSCVSGLNSTEVSFFKCSQHKCSMVWVFLGLIALSGFCNSCAIVPTISAVLRITDDSERTFALGIWGTITRVLGTIPGPIIFGAIIDGTCRKWGEKCGVRTSCWLYDNDEFAFNMGTLCVCLSAGALLFYILGLILYKRPSSNVYEVSGKP